MKQPPSDRAMKPMFLESRMFFAQPQTVISVPSAGVFLNSERISVRSIVVLLYKEKRQLLP